MPSIFKPTGKSKYEIHYSDHDGRRRKKVLTPDRAISERLAAKLLERVAAIRGGLWTEQDENYADHGRRPIRDHIADYVEHLRSKGSSKHHVSRSKFGIERVCDLAKVKTPGDLSLSRVEAALAEISKSKVASTVNLEIRIFKSFVHWLIEDRRIRDNPLLGLKARREVIKPRLRRRWTDEEVQRLLLATEQGTPTPNGFTALDRAMLYKLALSTGLRASELRSLTPESFRLDESYPVVQVKAIATKNRQEASQPLPSSLVSLLRLWLATKPSGQRVFTRMDVRQSEMLQRDLEQAGVKYQTEAGQLDFHSLRHEYISRLVQSGASVKTAQTLARHASPTIMVSIYAKASVYDLHGAVEKLPDLNIATSDQRRATGTDDATPGATREIPDGPNILPIK